MEAIDTATPAQLLAYKEWLEEGKKKVNENIDEQWPIYLLQDQFYNDEIVRVKLHLKGEESDKV